MSPTSEAKRCRKCDVVLVEGDNWASSSAITSRYYCRACRSKIDKKYRRENSKKIKKVRPRRDKVWSEASKRAGSYKSLLALPKSDRGALLAEIWAEFTGKVDLRQGWSTARRYAANQARHILVRRWCSVRVGTQSVFNALPKDERLSLRAKARIELFGDTPTTIVPPGPADPPKPIDPTLARIRRENRKTLDGFTNQQTTAKEGYVYVLWNPVWPTKVKIGAALDYEDRTRSFQTGDPHRAYELVAQFHVEDRIAGEKKAHRALDGWRVPGGEWFTIDKHVAARKVQQVCDSLSASEVQ